jgi:serine/threonine protein phosphatase 1
MSVRVKLAAEGTIPRVADDERVYAIGDVHGRRDLLLQLLDAIERDGRRHRDGRAARLVFLGDYIDRGDESAAVLDVLAALAAADLPRLDFLLGNHEAALLAFLETPASAGPWLAHGGRQTFASYGLRPPAVNAREEDLIRARDQLSAAMGAHKAFLEGLQPMARSGQVVFVHAGVNPDNPDLGEDRQSLLWGHPACRGAAPLPGLRIVHGHFDAPEPVVHPGRICVDTGAYYSGRLTAVRLDHDTAFLSVGR